MFSFARFSWYLLICLYQLSGKFSSYYIDFNFSLFGFLICYIFAINNFFKVSAKLFDHARIWRLSFFSILWV